MTTAQKHLLAITAVIFYLAVLKKLHTSCPVLYLTGHSCPSCGTTRALISLAKGDIKAYIGYNPFALPLAAAILCMLHLKFFRHKKAVEAVSLAIAAGAVLRWIIISL